VPLVPEEELVDVDGVVEVPVDPEVSPAPVLETCCMKGFFRVLNTSFHMPELEVE